MVLTIGSQQWSKLRLGYVTNINYSNQTCDVEFYDRIAGVRNNVLLAQPYMGRGWGIMAGVEIGSIVVVGEEANGYIRILAYLPHAHFFSDEVNQFIDVSSDESPYHKPLSGELVLQSKANSIVALNTIGDIILQTPEGNSIELDREADLIFQQSSQRDIVCDAGVVVAGVVRRDIRSLEERQMDILYGGVTNLGFDFDIFTETIGLDPKYPIVGDTRGRSDIINSNIIPGLFDPLFPTGFEIAGGSGANTSDMLNPAVTEWNTNFYEFGDGNPGIDSPLLNDIAKAKGHIEPNVLAQVMMGTLVNEVGRQIRFDYNFDTGEKGHGFIWTTRESVNTSSTDHYFNRSNTLKSLTLKQPQSTEISAPGHNSNSEWTVDSSKQTPTAVMFRTLLHTKGANDSGQKETDISIALRTGDQGQIDKALAKSYPGSLWEFQVDKEGLTKWNIPAATDLQGLEPYRAGRSLLLNMDGDATVCVGRQLATGKQGLPRITNVDFLNRNDYPNYGRRGRSLTLDLVGNIEACIGADANVNQSIIMQADGSCALYLGKELGTPKVTDDFNVPITNAAKATTRADRSFTAQMAGNMEMQIDKDTEGQQSIIISTTGGNTLYCGKDRDDRSLEIMATGGIHIQIQGPMKEQNYALHIDAKGELHIQATGNIKVETEKQCYIKAREDISLESTTGSIKMKAAQNIEMAAGVMLNLSAPVINGTDGGTAGLSISNGNCGIKCGRFDVNTQSGVGILGATSIVGQVLLGNAEGAQPIARIGDLVQAGTTIGQIISGSLIAKSA